MYEYKCIDCIAKIERSQVQLIQLKLILMSRAAAATESAIDNFITIRGVMCQLAKDTWNYDHTLTPINFKNCINFSLRSCTFRIVFHTWLGRADLIRMFYAAQLSSWQTYHTINRCVRRKSASIVATYIDSQTMFLSRRKTLKLKIYLLTFLSVALLRIQQVEYFTNKFEMTWEQTSLLLFINDSCRLFLRNPFVFKPVSKTKKCGLSKIVDFQKSTIWSIFFGPNSRYFSWKSR